MRCSGSLLLLLRCSGLRLSSLLPAPALLRLDTQLARRARRHQLFLACGLTEDGAAQCTDVLLKNDLRGNESHGMSNSTSQAASRAQPGSSAP